MTRLDEALEGLGVKLSDTQKSATQGAKWLMFGGYRSGRTFLLATVILEELLIGGRSAYFSDHYPGNRGAENLRREVMRLIHGLRDKGWNIEYECNSERISTGIVQSPKEVIFNQPELREKKKAKAKAKASN